MRTLRAVIAAGLVTTLPGIAAGAMPAVSAAAGQTAPVAAIPVPGEQFAPDGTPLIFRTLSLSELTGISVVGSRSGVRTGSAAALPGGGSSFSPTVPFAGGETVTVTLPDVKVGNGGH